MNADAWKKSLLLHLPYGVIGLAAAKLSEAWRLSAQCHLVNPPTSYAGRKIA